MPIPGRKTLILLGGAVVLVLVAGWSLWRAVAVPRAEAALSRAVGYRATIGRLWPGLRTVRARDVLVFGAPPFDRAPLARLEAVDVRLGGSGAGFWQPSAVLARGVKITYLRVGGLDNVRGNRAPPTERRGGGAGAVSARAARSAPALTVRDPSFEVFIRRRVSPGGPDGGRALVARGSFTADRGPDGRLAARVEQASLEVPGWGSLAARGIEIFSGGGRRSFAAGSARLVGAEGQPLHDKLVGGGVSESGRTQLWLRSAPGSEPALSATAELAGSALRANLETSELPLAALAGPLRRLGVDPRAARLGGRVSLERQPPGPVAADVALEISGLSLEHRRLDRRPWTDLSLKLRGSGAVFTDGPRLSLDGVEVEALGLPLVVQGFTELGRAPRGQWQVVTPEAGRPGCAELLAAQPLPVRETLSGLVLDGELGARVELAFDATAWENTRLAVKLAPLCRVRREPEQLEALLSGRPVRASEGTPPLPLDASHPGFVSLSELPRSLPAAFLTAEDASFFSHEGFDLENIRRALAHDLQVGDFARGASTITQQLAKNLFLGPERTLGRKLSEVVLAWRLHERLPKQRILELYLNVIELGPGIRGVKRAAEVYFGKPVKDLGPLESAHLAALTPNPHGFSRRFRDGRVDEGWLRKLYDLLGMMNRSGRLSRAELAAARKSGLVLQRI